MKSLLTFASLAMLVFAGCNAAGPNRTSYSYLRLPDTSRAQAFAAAEQAMSERFRIAREDSVAGIITAVSDPLPTEQSHRLRDVVGLAPTQRRAATAQVMSAASGAEVWCRVVIERYETEDRYLFDQDRRGTDVPNETAADRGGATTPEQNALWQVERRDRVTERSILRSVEELVKRPSAEPPPTNAESEARQ